MSAEYLYLSFTLSDIVLHPIVWYYGAYADDDDDDDDDGVASFSV